MRWVIRQPSDIVSSSWSASWRRPTLRRQYESLWRCTTCSRNTPTNTTRALADRAALEAYAPPREWSTSESYRAKFEGEDDANLVHGTINGGTAQIYQQLVFRPTRGLGRPETPIEGLYVASAAISPSGGVRGARAELPRRGPPRRPAQVPWSASIRPPAG